MSDTEPEVVDASSSDDGSDSYTSEEHNALFGDSPPIDTVQYWRNLKSMISQHEERLVDLTGERAEHLQVLIDGEKQELQWFEEDHAEELQGYQDDTDSEPDLADESDEEETVVRSNSSGVQAKAKKRYDSSSSRLVSRSFSSGRPMPRRDPRTGRFVKG